MVFPQSWSRRGKFLQRDTIYDVDLSWTNRYTSIQKVLIHFAMSAMTSFKETACDFHLERRLDIKDRFSELASYGSYITRHWEGRAVTTVRTSFPAMEQWLCRAQA